MSLAKELQCTYSHAAKKGSIAFACFGRFDGFQACKREPKEFCDIPRVSAQAEAQDTDSPTPSGIYFRVDPWETGNLGKLMHCPRLPLISQGLQRSGQGKFSSQI